MSDCLHYFDNTLRRCAVALPFELDARIAEWQTVRNAMIRECPEPFTREEWAYLLSVLDPQNLRLPFGQSFGPAAADAEGPVAALIRPRGPVAIWLPSNVSLLGPLVLVLLSLTGNPVRIKGGSQAEDLAGAFLDFARGKLPEGSLQAYLEDTVQLERFDRDDPRNRAMAAEAAVRVVFGSDAAVTAVDALPHPVDSTSFAFSDRRSEAWLQCDRLDDETLSMLIRVFAIYGQAGCTSPSRVVLLDATSKDVLELRDRLLDLWPRVIPRDPPMHVASNCVMVRQWAAAVGWNAVTAPRNAAVLAVGTYDLPPATGLMALPIVPATAEEAAARLPENIQTIGHALSDAGDPRWLRLLATTGVKRFVSLKRMHHFGPVWDGWDFWRQMFEEVEIETYSK